MSTFKLDTSGAVWVGLTADQNFTPMNWSDLSPFVQGYIEAAFTHLYSAGAQFGSAPYERAIKGRKPVGFSDLASETLARILEDCEQWQGSYRRWVDTQAAGSEWWRTRQRGDYAPEGLRPLTPYLGDDGKIYFKS